MSWLVPALGGGVAFGLAVQYGDHALGSFRAAVWIGAPWLLVAFAAGALVRQGRRVAAATGAGVLTSATAAYYLVVAAHGSLLYAAAMTVAWGAVAALVAPAARSPERPGAAAAAPEPRSPGQSRAPRRRPRASCCSASGAARARRSCCWPRPPWA
jgi:hypothetical protein